MEDIWKMEEANEVIEALHQDWEKRKAAKAEEARLAEEEEIGLMKLVQEWGLAITRTEAQVYLDLARQLIDLGQDLWPTDRAARRRMISAFAVCLQITAGNDEVQQIIQED